MENNITTIKILLATARKGRQSEKVSNFIYKEIRENNKIRSSIIDVRDYLTAQTVPPWENHQAIEQARKAINGIDGLLIVTPEYNHGFPGELKIFLDKIKNELKDVPVGICGVSSGGFGGSRGVELLLPILIALKARPILPVVYFSNVEDMFKNDRIQDDSYKGKIEKLIEELQKYSINKNNKI